MGATNIADRRDITPLTLRDYQIEALEAIAAAEARGIRRQLLVLPTGAGKTIIFAELIRRRGAWRTRPASERQLQALRRFRLPAPPDLTAGEASDRLARAIARARD